MTMLMTPYMFTTGSGGGGGGSAVAPTFGAVGAHSAGSINAAYPSGISAGDLLQLVIATTAGDATTAYSLSGWTQLTSYMGTFTGAPTGGGNQRLTVLYKVATGSESGSVTVTRTGTAPNRDGAVIQRVSGVDTSGTPYEGLQTLTNSSTGITPLASPAITTSANGRLLINHYCSPLSAITLTPGAGWTEAWEFARSGVGPDYIFSTNYKDASGFGAQASESPTPASGSAYIVVSYALIGV